MVCVTATACGARTHAPQSNHLVGVNIYIAVYLCAVCCTDGRRCVARRRGAARLSRQSSAIMVGGGGERHDGSGGSCNSTHADARCVVAHTCTSINRTAALAREVYGRCVAARGAAPAARAAWRCGAVERSSAIVVVVVSDKMTVARCAHTCTSIDGTSPS